MVKFQCKIKPVKYIFAPFCGFMRGIPYTRDWNAWSSWLPLNSQHIKSQQYSSEIKDSFQDVWSCCEMKTLRRSRLTRIRKYIKTSPFCLCLLFTSLFELFPLSGLLYDFFLARGWLGSRFWSLATSLILHCVSGGKRQHCSTFPANVILFLQIKANAHVRFVHIRKVTKSVKASLQGLDYIYICIKISIWKPAQMQYVHQIMYY